MQKGDRKEEFGENYSVNYLATFTEFAQAERHRTLSYEMKLLEEPKFLFLILLGGTKLEEEWLKDIKSLSKNFPSGYVDSGK